MALWFFLLVATICPPVFGRTLQWAGKNWLVKDGSNLGPGPNDWSDSTNNVWVDASGYLHLKITESGGVWYCAEIQSEQSFGYGEYRFFTRNRIDQLDTNTVGGLFTYLDDDNEIDIEFVKAWTGTNNANFIKQPSRAGSQYNYYIDLSGDLSTHRFTWETNSIFFQSYHAHGSPPPDTNFVIAEWTYVSNDVPVASTEKVHLNMWLFQGRSPSDTQHLEMIIQTFVFIPSTNTPPPDPPAGFQDDFNDQTLSNIWVHFNDAELSVETNGTLRVNPPGALTDQAGVVTTNAITWNSNSGCVFRAQIDWIDVTQPGTSNNIDVKTLMAAVSESESPWFATNAAILLGAYSETNDTLGLSFRTKTDS
ncbi:MAG: glycoside hydrolase family 16 protein, partial [Thermodesulfobacteriota bacterium]|nr:glycoside hydrolase family 16 protein [Thermodesulfobacteriota bacterium]